MKHDIKITALLLLIFALAQIVGLWLVTTSLQEITCDEAGCVAQFDETIVGNRPETTGAGSAAYVLGGIAIGTIALIYLAKFNQQVIWRAWFFLAVALSVTIAFGVFMPPIYAWILGIALATWKLWKPNMIIYNIAEIFMYGGIAVLFVPILQLEWMIGLLVIISLYDMYAVWKSKHMVRMATFINASNAFAGLLIPYERTKKKTKIRLTLPKKNAKSTLQSKSKRQHAILGGGDITFPLLFAGVFVQERTIALVQNGSTLAFAQWHSFFASLGIVLGATIAIGLLFLLAKKNRFYPAMPFVTGGTLLGWGIALLLI